MASDPRIIPPEEARRLMDQGDRPIYDGKVTRLDLAHTVAVLAEQRAAALALHRHYHWCTDPLGRAVSYSGPRCPTARALGVS